MDRFADEPRAPGVPPPPSLPDVDSPAPEDVLDTVPSEQEVVEDAKAADAIIAEQPSVDAILGR